MRYNIPKPFLFFFLLLCLIVFTICKKLEKEMLVSTGEVTNILPNSADASGLIIDLGDGVTQHGHCYGKNANVSISDSKTQLGKPAGTGGFTSQLTNLEAGTKYYIKAYISSGSTPVYGKEISFTTIAASVPTLTTTAITSITTTAAASGGEITSEGGALVTSRGVCWSTSTGPTTADSKTSDGTGTGSFTSNLTGLTPNITYYVRAYAINSAGTAYGSELSFKTVAASPPTLSTTTITGITQTTATGEGNVTNDGGVSVTARGVCWNTTGSPTVTESKTEDGPGTGSFASSLTGLTGNTSYYVRAYATNSAGTSYGAEVSFKTSPVIASLTTTAITSIGLTSASSGGNITSDGGSAVTARGVCWNTSTLPTTANSKTTDGSGSGGFSSSLTGLAPNTKYYVRAYAVNTEGTAYGNEISFTTGTAVPTLSTAAIGSITKTGATSGGNITSDGGVSVTARGVCWSITPNPTIENEKSVDGAGTGTFASSITGLTGNTTYYVRAYATNSTGTGYGNELTFTTSPLVPMLTTTAITTITQATASSGGNISNDGGAAVTTRGVCWSTTANPTTTDSKTSDGTGLGNFTSSLTGLAASTKYYVRAYATNSAGTGYGNELTFTTNVVDLTPPTAAAATATLVANTTATLNGAVNANGSSTSVIFEYGTTFLYGSTADATPSPVTGVTPTSVSAALTGLIPGTTYHFRVKAVSAGGTVYSTDLTFTTLQLPIAITDAATAVTATTATLNGTVNANGSSTTVTFEYGTTMTYGSTVTATQSPVTGNSTTIVSAGVSGLTEGVTYHFRVKAVSAGGTSYGADLTFASSCMPPTATTNAASGIGSTTATLNGTVNANGFSTTVSFEYGLTISYGSTIAATPGTVTGSSNTSVSAGLTGLTSNTLYHYKVKTSNCGGAIDGNDLTFVTSTIPGAPTIGTATKGNAQATVTFTAPVSDGGSAITGYTATSNPGGLTGTGATSPITVTGLTNGTAYTFTVTATNANGTGPASSASNSVTPSTVPGAPTIGTATKGNAQATVTFTAPVSNGGSAITGYTATSSPGGLTGTGSASPITVTGLTNGTAYAFTVTATNANGTGPASSASNSVTPSTVPGAPTIGTATKGNAQATVTFTAPASNGGSAITGYTATSNPGGLTGTSATSPITVTGLTNGTAYTFTVTATNANGTGPASAASNSVTPSTVPGAPTIGTATKGNAQATVTFTPPASDGGSAITGYTATSNPGGLTGTGSASPVTVTGLTNGTAYAFTVTATNANGIGQASSASNSVTPSTVPGAPTIGTATAGNAQATVTFTAPVSNGGSAITGYTATSSPGGFTGTSTASPITVTGLTNGTAYSFTVTATNANGTGPASSASNSVTPSLPPIATTAAASIVTSTTATLNGTVNANNLSTTVTFEYGPTISYGFTVTAIQSPVSGNLVTNVSVPITALTPNATYHFRVKAISTSGTSYGNDLPFSTPARVTDIDGNVYNTVQISTQIWMAENLKTTKYNNGALIPQVTDPDSWWQLTTPAYCWYNNNQVSYGNTYGALYNWYTVGTGNLCPSGYRVPTQTEWQTLITYLGGSTLAGIKAKETGTTHWSNPNNATNESGFTALPGGSRNPVDGTFQLIYDRGYWWSSTMEVSHAYYYIEMRYNWNNIMLTTEREQLAFSVRCIKY